MERNSAPKACSCPNCGFPLSNLTRLCFHCKKFVDVNSGRVLQPGEVSDAELDHLTRVVMQVSQSYDVNAAGKTYKRGKILLIVSIILMVTMLLAIVGFVLLIVALRMMSKEEKPPRELMDKDELEQVMAEYLVTPLLTGAFDQVLEYSHARSITAQEIRRAQLMQEAYNEVTGSDYIKASFHGLPVELSDLELKLERINELGISKKQTVFKGSFLVCRLGITLPEQVTIWEREGRPPMGPGLLTGFQAFDQKFYVESRHPQTAQTLLTPKIMEQILQLDLVGNGQTTLKFMEDGTLYVAIASTQDLFEMQQMGEPAAALRQRYGWELNRILQVLSIAAQVRT